MRIIIIGILALIAASESSWALEPTIEIKVPGYSEADAKVALDLFRRKCRPLGTEFWNDITDIDITIDEETLHKDRLERAWKNTVILKLKYSSNPQYGPAYGTGTGILAGHTLYYAIGAGAEPGFFASKRVSQYLCGLSFNTKGEDIFVAVPEFQYLNR